MKFEFATATQIIFGPGTLAQLGGLATGLGRHALVVGGATPARLAPMLTLLHDAHIVVTAFHVSGEPTIDTIRNGVQQAHAAGCDLVIGIGGGSVIDTGKAIAALLTNGGDPLDYLEVVGRGQTLQYAPAPYIALPTTAGTGAEVTRNAVLGVPERRVKVSLRSPLMLPRIALVDPELTYALPPAVTASTGLDALTQCIEPFVSPQATPLTDGFCREGMRRAAGALRRAYHAGNDTAAREDLALASLCGGLALANARLGAVHGFASPLGGMFPAPHGALCGRLLPPVMAANVRALRTQTPDALALARYDEVARILTGDHTAHAEDGVAWIEALVAELAIPPLASYGMTEIDIPEIVTQAQAASSMRGNPITLTDAQLSAVLRKALAG